MRTLFHRQAGGAGDGAPALDLGLHEVAEGLAAFEVDAGALLGPDPLDVRLGQRRLDGGVQGVERGGGRSSWAQTGRTRC